LLTRKYKTFEMTRCDGEKMKY